MTSRGWVLIPYAARATDPDWVGGWGQNGLLLEGERAFGEAEDNIQPGLAGPSEVPTATSAIIRLVPS